MCLGSVYGHYLGTNAASFFNAFVCIKLAVSRTRLNAVLDELDALFYFELLRLNCSRMSVTIHTDHVRRKLTVGYFKIAFYRRDLRGNENIGLNEGQKPYVYEDAPLETSR